jgi:hypothetical protein
MLHQHGNDASDRSSTESAFSTVSSFPTSWNTKNKKPSIYAVDEPITAAYAVDGSVSPTSPSATTSTASTNRRRSSTFSSYLINTLLPKQKMEVELQELMTSLHAREKVSEEDLIAVKHSILFLCFVLVFVFGVVTFMSFILVFEQQVETTAPSLQAAIGCISLCTNMIGILGAKFESDRLLNAHLSLSTILMLVTLLAGTFSIVSTEQSVRRFEMNAVTRSRTASKSLTTPNDLRSLSYAAGSLTIFTVPLQCLAAMSTSKMLTTIKALTNFVETLTILMFPVGAVFIAGGVYVVQHVQDAAAGSTALLMFVIGCFVVVLSALGYFGVKIPSRGILLMFQWPTFMTTIFLFLLGLVCLIQAEEVSKQLNNSWESTRTYLPTTFQGRYDRVLFSEFITTNLQMMAFGCLYASVFFCLNTIGAGGMRYELKVEQELLQVAERRLVMHLDLEERKAEEQQCIATLMEQGLSNDQALLKTFDMFETEKLRIQHYQNFKKKHRKDIHKLWKTAWKKGSEQDRCAVRCGCGVVFATLAIIVGCALSALIYTSFCEGLNKHCVTQIETTIVQSQINALKFESSYTRGQIEITKNDVAEAAIHADTIQLSLKSCSLDDGFQKGSMTHEQNGTLLSYAISKVTDPPTYFGADKSCQQANLNVQIPQQQDLTKLLHLQVETEVSLNIHGATAIKNDGSSSNTSLALGKLVVLGTRVNIALHSVIIHYIFGGEKKSIYDDLHRAIHVKTDIGLFKWTGDKCSPDVISLYQHGLLEQHSECSNHITCDYTSTIFPVPSFFVESINGFIEISDVEIFNCDLNIVSKDSCPTTLDRVFAKCDSKYCNSNNKIDINGKRGSVQMKEVVSDTIKVRTTEGRVTIQALTQLNPETGVSVSTESGNISIESLIAAGNIQIETQGGDIVLKIPMCGQLPAYSGTFQIAFDDRIQNSEDVIGPPSRVASKDVWNKLREEMTVESAKESMLKSIVITSAQTSLQTGSIGCHFSPSCAYANELMIKTRNGRVSVIIDETVNVCTTTK